MNIPTFEGILTVVATPFDQNGAIVFDVLGKHIDFLLANRIGTMVPGGTTGEYYAQTVDERKKVMSFVAERVGKKAKLVAGTNSTRPDDTIEKLARRMAVDDRPLERFLVLNGLSAHDTLKPGDKVKIVVE